MLKVWERVVDIDFFWPKRSCQKFGKQNVKYPKFGKKTLNTQNLANNTLYTQNLANKTLPKIGKQNVTQDLAKQMLPKIWQETLPKIWQTKMLPKIGKKKLPKIWQTTCYPKFGKKHVTQYLAKKRSLKFCKKMLPKIWQKKVIYPKFGQKRDIPKILAKTCYQNLWFYSTSQWTSTTFLWPCYTSFSGGERGEDGVPKVRNRKWLQQNFDSQVTFLFSMLNFRKNCKFTLQGTSPYPTMGNGKSASSLCQSLGDMFVQTEG